MKTKLRFFLAFALVVLLIASTALANTTCSFTFTSQGKTYHVYHQYDGKNSWYEIPDKMTLPDKSLSYAPSREYYVYIEDRTAAFERHAATCPYMHNLGDVRMPMPLLYGGAALALAAIILVHSLRKKHRRLPAVKSLYAQSK